MANIKVKCKKLKDNAMVPMRKSEQAACFDLATTEAINIRNINVDMVAKVGTGLAFEIPKGYHMKIFLRSGISFNTPIRMANHVAIIDSDYRGEVMLLLENNSRKPQRIEAGTRVAQCLIEKNVGVDFVEVTDGDLEDTLRGTGGFGSTGVK